jgi:hypothetical protein
MVQAGDPVKTVLKLLLIPRFLRGILILKGYFWQHLIDI